MSGCGSFVVLWSTVAESAKPLSVLVLCRISVSNSFDGFESDGLPRVLGTEWNVVASESMLDLECIFLRPPSALKKSPMLELSC